MAGAPLFEQLAALFAYPREDFHARVESIVRREDRVETEAKIELEAFASSTRGMKVEEAQELFVRTFEHNPATALELGWHLFGEQYDRGEFLVAIRRELKLRHIEETVELPDHLTHVLPLLARMDAREAAGLATFAVLPALEKIEAGLGDGGNPYRRLIKALKILVDAVAAEHRTPNAEHRPACNAERSASHSAAGGPPNEPRLEGVEP